MPDTALPKDTQGAGSRAGLKRLVREPLVHFLLIAAVLFVAYRAFNPGVQSSLQSNRIVLTEDDLKNLSITWLAQGRPAPTPEQMQHLIAAKVHEEILYREALALGLDKDDTIVKRRMAQKLEFLAEDLSGLEEPSTADLKAWYKANAKRFALPARVSFRHIYFSFDRHQDRTRQVAASALKALAGKPAEYSDDSRLGDPFMFQDSYGDRTPTQVNTLFGAEFANAVFSLVPGSWQGPVVSGYGWHLIWIDSMSAARIPDFEEVESEVKAAWTADQREQSKRKMFEVMRARYQVVLPDASGVPAALDNNAGRPKESGKQ